MENETTKKDVIAMVGAGQGGYSILETLIEIPSVEVHSVCDIDENAPGITLARQKNIKTIIGDEYHALNNKEINLILEITGKQEVIDKLKKIKSPKTNLIGAAGTTIMFHLLDSQRRDRQKLEEYKNSLQDGIVDKTEQLQEANQALQDKIFDYQCLNEKLQQINDEKTKYLLHATHQLKAPFAAIQSYVDIIIDGYTGTIADQTRNIMEKIKQRCEFLSTSIKDMLELANLKSCVEENIQLGDINIIHVLEGIIAQNKVLCDQKRIELAFNTFQERCIIKCNKAQMIILFSVLIENAIHYSKNNTKIEINISKTGQSRVSIAVKDQGVGISKDNLPKVFQEYFRTNEGASLHENGSGLGLAIAKQIANLHNFNIEVDSEMDQGTTFTVHVPTFLEE